MPVPDLLAATAALIDIPSVSHQEAEIVEHIEARLRAQAHLDVERVGPNLVARTQLGRARRIVLAGHTDTVPPNGNEVARIEGDVLWGLGASDMKGGLAVMLALAESVPEPAIDVTYVFYATEEVASEHNGLGHLARDRPDLLAGDVAILGEPTGGELEAGCQGTMRLVVTVTGARAHTARPWMGRNAIHRLGRVLDAVASFEERRPVIDGCEFHEALQAVAVSGGVAGNVVPDVASVTINRRFAPDRSADEAEAEVRALLATVIEDGDTIEVVDVGPAAHPGLSDPVLRSLIDDHGLTVRSKLGWTDVARFAELGIPACNLGPGDAALAHNADERVDRASLERAYAVLSAVLSSPLAG
ncbi:MAG TPA: succinyl-diaminopimelate desuccinylase [Acidimicrobiales bacterium]